MQTPALVRDRLAQALALDLVGPEPDDAAHAEEVLPAAPSVWYLTGFLVPFEAPPGEREGDDADGELDAVERTGGGDDEASPEATAARKGLFPSSIGVSLLVPAAARISRTSRQSLVRSPAQRVTVTPWTNSMATKTSSPNVPTS